MKIGDSAKTKKGVLDPEFEKYDMTGWQGRIIEIDHVDGIDFEIELDSFTLKKIPRQYIYDSLYYGSDYAIINVSSIDVEKTEPRDTVDEVRVVRKTMNEKLDYVSILDDEENIERLISVCNIILKVKNQKILYDDLMNTSLN
jgi:hypothetical protein